MRDVHDPTTVTPIRFDGVIDADGHILEPPALWEDYIEAPLRDRALRVRINDEGLEYLEIDGRPSPSHRAGILSELGRTYDSELGDPARRYLDDLPYGSMDPAASAIEPLDAPARTALLGSNVARCYGLSD